MAKFFAWVLLLFSVAAFALGFRAQQVLSDAEHVKRELAAPLPQSFVSLDSQDYVEP